MGRQQTDGVGIPAPALTMCPALLLDKKPKRPEPWAENTEVCWKSIHRV